MPLMNNYVLCIFEGRKTEQNIANNMCHYLLNNDDRIILRASYGFNIYKLFEETSKDDYLDTYEIITEQLKKRGSELSVEENNVLNISEQSKISDIYLFFDYDAHCTNANNEKLHSMLNFFDNPQDRGLLCISYPMVEAIRHQHSADYQEVLHSIEKLKEYKSWLNKSTLLEKRYFNWGLYDLSIWSEIIRQHLARVNFLVNNVLILPESQIEQHLIFKHQCEKHIPNSKIAVISAFPLMLFDYYGMRLFDHIRINNKVE